MGTFEIFELDVFEHVGETKRIRRHFDGGTPNARAIIADGNQRDRK